MRCIGIGRLGWATAVVAAFATGCVPDVVHWESEQRANAVIAPGARLVLQPADIPAMTPGWVPPQPPTTGPVCAGSVVTARGRGDTTYAAWWLPRADSTTRLVVARSDDDGLNWRVPVDADSTDRGRAGCGRPAPFITVDSLNGYVHVVYFLQSSEGAGVFFTHSMNAGGLFHAPVAIVYGDRPSTAAVASNADTVAVAYQDPNAAVPQLRLALSRTDGHIFEHHVSVSPPGVTATRPAVAVRDGKVAVAWYESAGDAAPGVSVARVGRVRW